MTAHTEVLIATAAPAGERARARRRTLSVRTWDLLAMVAVIGLLVGIALFYVFLHLQVVRVGYEVERFRHERAALVEQGRTLTLEVAGLRSVKRVEEYARGTLGMVTPAPGQVIVVR
jgi:cell division protein FtsL